jgi:hypothetical protein
MTNDILKKPLKYFRAAIAKGASKVDRDGGRYGFGVVTGVSVITRGEALGHEMWVDQDFMSDVVAAINAKDTGTKARFTHPGLSSDGLGTYLGKLHDAVLIDDQVIADLHFKEAATKTPDGNLADYVMTLAAEAPEDFGLSIVFDNDEESSLAHMYDNTFNGRFVSPDEENKNNYIHARLASLRAGDVVDSPAANPNGLFHRQQEFAAEAEQIFEYTFGLSDAKPDLTCFDVDVDRLSAAVSRFLSRHDLKLSKGETGMTTEASAETLEEVQPTREGFAAELQRYTTAFGAENGSQWYADGLNWSECLERHMQTLQDENTRLQAEVVELKELVASIDLGEEEIIGQQPDDQPKLKTFTNAIRIQGKQYDRN